ncbi:hypothetical protein D9M69_403190 [compost metagenome]
MVIVVVVDSAVILCSLGFDPGDSRFLQLKLVIQKIAVQRSVLSLQILEQLVKAAVIDCIVEQGRFLPYQVCHLGIAGFELVLRTRFTVE